MDSYIHSAFENTSAVAAGVESACKVLKRKGKIQDNFKILAIGGDGGTYDIGFQSLSGALERGHDFTYFCYDNEAYMNTGTQRSSATPRFASATTTPAGRESVGKKAESKRPDPDRGGPRLPYVAQTTFLGNFKRFPREGPQGHLYRRPHLCQRALPLPPGAGSTRRAAAGDLLTGGGDLRLAPLRGGKRRVPPDLYAQKKKRPVEEFMKLQGRFRHCFKPGNEWTIEAAQQYVDEKWEALLAKCK